MPDFAFTEEQDALRATVRRFCDERSPSTEVRRLMDTTEGFDPDVWKQLAAELGLTGIHIAEDEGGSGLHVRRARRSSSKRWDARCCCAPFFSSICLAANAIRNAGTPEQRQALAPGDRVRRPARGARLHRTVRRLDARRHHARSQRRQAHRHEDLRHRRSHRRSPHRRGEGRQRHLVLHRPRRGEGPDAHAARHPRHDAQAGRDHVRQRRRRRRSANAGQAADALAQDARASSGVPRGGVASAARRRRWTWPCSTRRTATSSAVRSARSSRSSTSARTCSCASSRRSRPRTTRRGPRPRTTRSSTIAASLAKAYCTESYFTNSRENIQVHGGIGFTYEHDAHLYYRRAKSSELLLGDPTYHRELIATKLGI